MKSSKGKRQITLLTLVVALGVAVYLNWQYARTDAQVYPAGSVAVQAAASSVEEALPDKNYGDAQLVSAGTTDGYFEQARLNRSKTRDDALDKLEKSLKDAKLDDTEKQAVTENLTAVIASITTEGDIESLVKAKGFTDCVVFIDGKNVNVAVKAGDTGLTPEAVAQIRDIVLAKVDTDAKNITVVEVK